MQVDRKRENLTCRHGLYAIGERDHLGKTVDVTPDPLVVSVEDMGAIFVDQNAGFVVDLRMAVAADMIPLVNNRDGMTILGQLARYHRPAEPGTDN